VASGKCKTAEDAKDCMHSEYNITISTNSIRRILKHNGLKSKVCKKKPLLRVKHRQARYSFAKRFSHWTDKDWKRIIWTDESKFNLYGSDGRQYCWKRPADPLQSHHLKPTVKYGGGGILVWGCMTPQGVGYLRRIEGKMNALMYQDILSDDYIDTLEYYDLSKEATFMMHDNDPKHKANSTTTWLEENEIDVLPWPSQSPDLNPIENLWNEVDRRVRKRAQLPTNKEELWTAVLEEWNGIPPDLCAKLCDTMPRRLKDVRSAKGGYTTW
jgi:transposase